MQKEVRYKKLKNLSEKEIIRAMEMEMWMDGNIVIVAVTYSLCYQFPWIG